jgi:hypothetical protein
LGVLRFFDFSATRLQRHYGCQTVPPAFRLMDLRELKAAFSGTDILLVEVEDLGDSDESPALRVAGNIESYTAAVKALNIPVVFFSLEKLETTDFTYSPEDGKPRLDDDDDEEEDSPEHDLCSVNVELGQFKSHLGGVGRIRLYAPMQPNGLTYFIENEWYAKFWECWDTAAQSVDQGYASAKANRDEADNRRRKELIARLDGLLNDNKFARLPTQKAKIAYAKMKIPGIDCLGSGALKDAISDLSARIDAKAIE